MKKIIIIGCPGSGKSTFAKKLKKILNLEIYHLDMIYWKKDKTTVSKEEFKHKLIEIMKNDEWIIDGNYGSTIEMRLEKCDTVFFLDYSLDICLNGIKTRAGKQRDDMPWVEKSTEKDEEFIKFIKNYSINSKPKIMNLLEKYSDKNIQIFKNRTECDDFINNLKI